MFGKDAACEAIGKAQSVFESVTRAELAECRRRVDELENRHVAASGLVQKLEHLESNLAALYKHLGIEPVKVTTVTTTEKILTGIRDVIQQTREEMRKVPKEK